MFCPTQPRRTPRCQPSSRRHVFAQHAHTACGSRRNKHPVMPARRYLKERQGNPPRRTRSRAATPVRKTLRPASRLRSAMVGVGTVWVPAARHCARRFSISLAWGWHRRLIAGEGAAAACRQGESHRISSSQLAAVSASSASAPFLEFSGHSYLKLLLFGTQCRSFTECCTRSRRHRRTSAGRTASCR